MDGRSKMKMLQEQRLFLSLLNNQGRFDKNANYMDKKDT